MKRQEHPPLAPIDPLRAATQLRRNRWRQGTTPGSKRSCQQGGEGVLRKEEGGRGSRRNALGGAQPAQDFKSVHVGLCRQRFGHRLPCSARSISLLLLALWGWTQPTQTAGSRRQKLLPARGISRVYQASAPPGSGGRSDEFGPRRAVGSKDIDGRGVQHELPSFGPFLFLEDALLPRGTMPPFGKHPHAGLLCLTLLLRGDCVTPWDNIYGKSATLRPGGLYVVDSAAGVVHSEEHVVPNPRDDGTATHVIFVWLDPGIFIREDPLPLPTCRVYLPREIPEVHEQGGLTVRVLLGSYLDRTSPFGHLSSQVELFQCVLAAGAAQQAVHVPSTRRLAFIFVPRFGGAGLFGTDRVRVSELQAAVLTSDGSFLAVMNDSGDNKPLHFLLATSPSAEQSPVALFGHNGAVFARTAAEARARMRQFEEEGDEFGDPFARAARIAAVPLGEGPIVPERVDLSQYHLDSDSTAAERGGAEDAAERSDSGAERSDCGPVGGPTSADEYEVTEGEESGYSEDEGPKYKSPTPPPSPHPPE